MKKQLGYRLCSSFSVVSVLKNLMVSSLLFLWPAMGLSANEWSWGRGPASLKKEVNLNQTAVLNCLEKMSGKLDAQSLKNLNELKTQIEIVYGLKKPQMDFREILYKTKKEEKWRMEAFIAPGSSWGKESYTLRFYKLDRTNGQEIWPEVPSPIGRSELPKGELLKFAQNENILSEERWEHFLVPGDPKLEFRSKNFKLYEINARVALKGKNLACVLKGDEYICTCAG